MPRFHVNNEGEVGTCKAAKDGCPFGSVEEHYTDRAEAEKASEKFMEEKYGAINSVYKKGAKNTEALNGMSRNLKKKIIENTANGETRLHPSVVGKVFANDNDELIRRRVAENMNSQNLLRQMSRDESAKVRLGVAANTRNPSILKELANDDDSKVRNAALANEKIPKRAKKETLQKLKEKRSAQKIDLNDKNNFQDDGASGQTLKPEVIEKIRKEDKPYYSYPGFSEKAKLVPGVKGDYRVEQTNDGVYHVSWYHDLNSSFSTQSMRFKSREEVDSFVKNDLVNKQKPYSEEETRKEHDRLNAYMKQREQSNYTGD